MLLNRIIAIHDQKDNDSGPLAFLPIDPLKGPGFWIDLAFVPLPRDLPHVVSALVVRDGDTIHLQRFYDFCWANEGIVGKVLA